MSRGRRVLALDLFSNLEYAFSKHRSSHFIQRRFLLGKALFSSYRSSLMFEKWKNVWFMFKEMTAIVSVETNDWLKKNILLRRT